MNRRFVNLVTRNWDSGIYALRRFNPNVLFYQSRNEAKEAAEINKMNSAADGISKMNSAADENNKMKSASSVSDENSKMKSSASVADASNKKKRSSPKLHSLRRLPEAIAKFDPSPTGLWHCNGLEWFELLAPGRSESRVVNANSAGDTMLYDADEGIMLNLPSLHYPKGEDPVRFSITHPGVKEDSLYIMDRFPGRTIMQRTTPGYPTRRSCFEVLECGSKADGMGGWGWRLLPPPPFIHQDGYKPTEITSHTVVGDGSTLCMSCAKNKIGTYCFDTMRVDPSHPLGWDNRDEWRHVGKWVLPFEGRAEYFPELKLWFGFTHCSRSHLCAVDLSAMDHGQQPIVQHVWEDLDLPEKQGCTPMRCRILNLGSGRFCVTKVINVEATGMLFAMFTGIEMVRSNDGQSIRMFKHKSTRYIFTTPDEIQWFL